MIRHTQLVLADSARGTGHDANGEAGDCLRACVASMLDVRDMTSIPNFAAVGDDHDWGWWIALRTWARKHQGDFASARVQWPIAYIGEHHRTVIATGPSPRGDWPHCVLVNTETGELVHDPHPSHAGLAGPISDVFAYVDPYEPGPAEQVAGWLREEQSS